MGWGARGAGNHSLAIALSAAIIALFCLLLAAERRLGLHQSASTRYRFHAIPVAISTLCHHHPHDYTAIKSLAIRFHDPARDLDVQIREAIDADPVTDGGTYYWVADDRGLADFVLLAFQLFGPRAVSLSNFWFLLLASSLALYTIAFWRTPTALVVPVLILLGWVAIASVAPDRLPFPNAQGYWGEEIALYESRMFDGLALVAVVHLAILAGTGIQAGRVTWMAAIPQTALLLFLYHARSSLGWQFVALFSLVAVRVGCWGLNRLRTASRPSAAMLFRPLLVAGLLGVAIAGLKQYQRLAYHPEYAREHGPRTFWHNALMGLAFHPQLRLELPMAHCDDRDAVDLVLARMEEREPELDKNVWNWQAALNSLGNHNPFDWNRYERIARSIYVDLWLERPLDMTVCYFHSKPREILRQARIVAGRVGKGMVRGAMPELFGASLLTLVALAAVATRLRRDPEERTTVRVLLGLVAFILPFGLIPGIAFYPALPTLTCFLLLSTTLGGLFPVLLTARIMARRSSIQG